MSIVFENYLEKELKIEIDHDSQSRNIPRNTIDPRYKKCGEIFLSKDDGFLFLCTICNESFIDFQIFSFHSIQIHRVEYEQITIKNDSQEEKILNSKNHSHSKIEETENIELYKPIEVSGQNEIENCIESEASTEEDDNISVSNDSKDPDFSPNFTGSKITLIEKSTAQPDTWFCDICGKYFSRKTIKKRDHNRAAHRNANNKQKRICEICGKTLGSQYMLMRHMNTHTGERPYKCQFCPQTFSFPGSKSTHEKCHTDDKRYKCNYCDKRFVQNSARKNHELVHTKTGEKPHECSLCKKKFLRITELKNHKKIHTNREDRPYKCSFCPKSYKNKDRLVPHESIHRGDYKYKCNFCNKVFMRKYAKDSHELVHTQAGQTPYACDLCDKKYARYAGLFKHKKKHHNIKKIEFKCDKCGKDFLNNDELKKHFVEHNIVENQYSCNYCMGRHSSEIKLQRHINQAHSGKE